MYKLVVLDMDGTLLNSQKEITSRVRTAINAAKGIGIKVVLASGRPIDGMLPALEALGLNTNDDYVLTCNASLTLNAGSKEVIRSEFLTGQDARDIYHLSVKLGVNTHAYSAKQGLITPKISKYTEHEADINQIEINICDFTTLAPDDEMLKIMMIDEAEALTAAINRLPDSFQEKYSMAQSAPFFYEFMSKKSGKANGVAALADYLGLTHEEVICVGDAGNDLEMLQYAGLGIAMANATEDVKAVADYITLSNDQDGVAHVFEKFVLA
ncbi:Cof-type HAD-IIB family hydrolase [Psychromonas sp. MB-3u-54]|uniref:Cof-type HAD-IIB family hydrolase n=1 Tax=Psychromonas sp. MB-3u-54 TaxID=2058319 RepID=UPI000C34A2C8|nr:Cof-type HAD-IIB family hydrolase [Psychromonas sp. MB-3u-54]PKH03286.1 Cof-type HAD-IIB family hydrolase [Psychromonas sp. MB-3u-54]